MLWYASRIQAPFVRMDTSRLFSGKGGRMEGEKIFRDGSAKKGIGQIDDPRVLLSV